MAVLTVLCVPLAEEGHENGTMGIAIALRNKGHRIVFATERSRIGKFMKYGFEEELYDCCENKSVWVEERIKFAKCSKLPVDQQLLYVRKSSDKVFNRIKYFNDQMEYIVERVKPNIIIEDHLFVIPALVKSAAPLIRLFTINPLYLFNSDELPPYFSGLPLNEKQNWVHLKQTFDEINRDFNATIYKYIRDEHGIEASSDPERQMLSTNLNIFVYPEFLVQDYLRLSPMGDEWIRLDHSIRESTDLFDIPEKLKNSKGKLIFFSLGSIGSSDIALMKRLIGILSKSPHKFIVVKGLLDETFNLPENMWGQSIVPQLAVIPQVDLVITHGGNNTFLESLYFGKPMIVLPLFLDQHDNAQRAVEMKIGLKLNAWRVEDNEVHQAIDKVLFDDEINANVLKISQEMKNSNSMEKVVQRIEMVAQNPKYPFI